MNRRTFSTLILIAWVAALGWLAARHWSAPRFGASAQRVPPGAAYYRVNWGDRQVGFASVTVDTLAPSDTAPATVRVSQRLVLVLDGRGKPERHEFTTNAFLSTNLSLRALDGRIGGPEGHASVRVRVTGDSLLATAIDSTGGPWTSTQRIDGPLLPLGALPIELAYREHPTTGATISKMIFDPATLDYYALGITVTGDSTFIVPDSVVKENGDYRVAKTDTLRAWRVAYTLRGVPMHAWFDVNGFPVQIRTGGGLDFERTAFDLANDGLKALNDTLHPPAGLPSPPPSMSSRDSLLAAGNAAWRMVLTGAEYPGLTGAGPLQSFSGDTIALTRMPFLPMRDPMRPLEPIPMTDLRFRATLRAEPRLSPDDSSVTALARRIVGHETSARIAASKLVTWIHGNITLTDDSTGGAWPTAAQILSARHGSAAGIATLMTALARRVGLPARPVSGIVAGRKGARRHSWVEVFIGDWVPVDPAFGQFPATPAHARLVIGATAHWAEYAPVAGALQPTALLDGE